MVQDFLHIGYILKQGQTVHKLQIYIYIHLLLFFVKCVPNVWRSAFVKSSFLNIFQKFQRGRCLSIKLYFPLPLSQIEFPPPSGKKSKQRDLSYLVDGGMQDRTRWDRDACMSICPLEDSI